MISKKEQRILELIREGRQKVYSSIYNDYTLVGRERHIFDWQTIYPRIHIMLPNTFQDLPAELAKVKYPSENRPKVIKSGVDIMTNFAFNYEQKKLTVEQLPMVVRTYAAAIHKLFPANEFMKSGAGYINGDKSQLLCWYEFLSPDLKERVFNLHGFLVVEHRLMQVVFSCNESRLVWWKPAALEVMASIHSDLDQQLKRR